MRQLAVMVVAKSSRTLWSWRIDPCMHNNRMNINRIHAKDFAIDDTQG